MVFFTPGLCCAGVTTEGTNPGGRPGRPQRPPGRSLREKCLKIMTTETGPKGGRGINVMAWVKGPGNLQRAALGPSPQRSPGVPCRVTRSRGARPPQVRGRGRGPTYCAGQPPGALLEQTHDLGLLRGRAAAADHRWALAGQLHELVFVVLEAYLAATGRGAGSATVPPPPGQLPGSPRPPPGSLRR